jgi:putative tryptophan/tyrosine transport system substrate-binding protein
VRQLPFARPLAAEAQRRVGALLFGRDNDPMYQSVLGAFREGLATFGWVEGRNLRIDYRSAAGDPSRLAADAEELVNLRPEVIFVVTGLAAQAVQQRTSIIPIVFVGGGATFFGVEMEPKRLQLLHELVPQASTIAFLVNPAQAVTQLKHP